MLLAHQEALQVYARRALKWAAVTATYDLRDLRTLMSVYQRMLSERRAYLAVRPMYGLANRLRAYCSAAAYAKQTSHQLLVVWEPDVHTQVIASVIASMIAPVLATVIATAHRSARGWHTHAHRHTLRTCSKCPRAWRSSRLHVRVSSRESCGNGITTWCARDSAQFAPSSWPTVH
jgi:hypothetical protein